MIEILLNYVILIYWNSFAGTDSDPLNQERIQPSKKTGSGSDRQGKTGIGSEFQGEKNRIRNPAVLILYTYQN